LSNEERQRTRRLRRISRAADAFIDDTAKQTGKGVGADASSWESSRRASFKPVAIQ
jgi:hypothetical protein